MKINTKELIAYLCAVNQSDEIEKVEFLTNGEPHRFVQEAVACANTALIDNQGRPNFEEHAVLAKSGFPVTCGERDSFGWLSGVIHTAKGKIVYG